jgi:Trk-type K+ transport system membrane component
VGGIGFPVLMQLRKELKNPLVWSMNTKLVLWGTAILLVGGTIFITVVEWNNPRTLGELNVWDRILSGFFQSVQTRTSGFNSIDIGAMREESWFGMDVMMLIGGGTAGTAGGIKIATFGVLLFIVLAELRGEGAVNIFGKRLSRTVHREATTVVLLAVACIVVSTMAILQTSEFGLSEVLFEVVSAFGTVGLSTGITADLDTFPQLVLVALMFVGRLGPMTLGTAIALRTRPVLYEFPKERPTIG